MTLFLMTLFSGGFIAPDIARVESWVVRFARTRGEDLNAQDICQDARELGRIDEIVELSKRQKEQFCSRLTLQNGDTLPPVEAHLQVEDVDGTWQTIEVRTDREFDGRTNDGTEKWVTVPIDAQRMETWNNTPGNALLPCQGRMRLEIQVAGTQTIIGDTARSVRHYEACLTVCPEQGDINPQPMDQAPTWTATR